MRDEAYSLDLLPGSLKNLSFISANDIEANLKYLILLFPYFSGSIRADALGSYGYLELTEAGCAGDGFSVGSAIRIDKIKIIVAGADLSALSFRGAGWVSESANETSLVIAYTSDEFMEPEKIRKILDELQFTSSASMDATITLQVSNTTEGDFAPVGPVDMIFRDGATWYLIEGLGMTWNDVESADMTWDDLENMKK